MIKGYINNHKPFVKIKVSWDNRALETEALVDTGFTGELLLPERITSSLGVTSKEMQIVYVGTDHAEVLNKAYIDVELENNTQRVKTLIGGEQGIIGMGILEKFDYELKVRFPDTVTLEK